MDDLRLITTDRGDAGRRLDLVLQRHLRDVSTASRTRIQAWIESGLVTVNETPVKRPSTRAKPGDIVAISLPATARRAVMAAEELPLDVIYEDDYLLAVNKPAGMVVHPTYRHPRGTLMNALLWHARRWPEGARPSLVGRLDRLTSGVLIVAKSRAIHAALQRLLSSAHAKKRYLAVVYGRVNVVRGVIDVRLSRSRQRRRTEVTDARTGSPSKTAFERVRRNKAPGVGLALLCCRLATGRTHQIRVHLAARGWPIVGDRKYGQPMWTQVEDARLSVVLRDFPRQALHAWQLSFEHPISGKRLVCEANLPDDLQRLLNDANLR